MKITYHISSAAIVAVVAIIGFIPRDAWAANLYWVGTDGASFATASNWKTTDPATCGSGDASAAPGASDVAIFDADCDNGALMSGTVSVLGFDLKSGYTGTVNSAAATVGVGTSGLVQAGGTFTATSGTMTITDGPITVSGGTFTHSSGTVKLTISSATALTLTTNGSSFYNFTISKPAVSASATTLTLADSFTIANDWTLDAVSGEALTIVGATDVTPTVTVSDDLIYTTSASASNINFGSSTASANFTVNLGGDLDTDTGAADHSGYLRANITFNGTGDQTIDLPAAAEEESGAWTGNKASGNILFASDITTEGNFSIASNTFNISDTDDWTMKGTFTQSGGTFTSTSGTLTIYNTFNKSAGTFTHGSGTVKFFGEENSYTITADSATFYNVTFDRSGAGVSNQTLTLADSFTVANNLVLQNQHSSLNLTLQGASSVNPTVTVQGNVSLPDTSALAGDINVGTSSSTTNFTINVEGNYSQVDSDAVVWATLIMGGSGTHTWSKSGGTFNSDFKVNKSGGEARLATAFATATANQDVIIEEGTFDITGFALTVNSSGSTLVVQDGGVLQLQGDETITANASNPQLNSGSTVTYDGTSGPYTVKDYSYHHLRFNGSGGTFNLGATESVAGNLTISAGTFDISGFSLTVTGTFSNDATFRLQGGETTVSLTMDVDSGLTVYDGTSSYTGLKAGNSYYDLTFDGSGGAWTLNAALDVDGDLTLTNGTLDVSTSNRAVNVAGDWNNSATFTPRSGTVTLDGASQALTGATTFYNLTKNVTSAATLTLPASTTQTISNALTLGGASGALLSLRSSVTDTQARIDPQGTRTVSFLDVKDNNNSNSTVLTCSTSCTNSGNNTNWSFDAASSNSAPTATAAHTFSQATDASGIITFKTTLSDADSDVTRLKVEYATNLGDWEDPTLDSVTANRGSASLSNSATYQITSIDTDGGDTELTIKWKSKSQLNNVEDTTVYIRLIPNDSTADGGAVISSAFTVDNKGPIITKPTLDDRTATSLTLKWVPGTTDVSFQRYTLCYGTNATHVNNCNNTAKVWTESNDPDLVTQTTNTTTITGLTTGARYRILLRGHDSKGNVTKSLSTVFIPAAAPLAPVLAASDIRDTTVALYWNRIQDDAFIRSELCYYSQAAARYGYSCDVTANPNPVIRKTFTSPTVLSDILTGLQASTTYYARLDVFYTGFYRQISNRLTVTTCPAGQYRVKNVCVDISHPSPAPTPTPSPTVTASPSPSSAPTATPSSSISPSDTPSPTPEGTVISSITETITETIDTVIETTTETIAAVVETIANIVETVTEVVKETVAKVIKVVKDIITSPRTGIPQARAALKPVVEQPAFKVTTTVATTAAVISVAAQASVVTSAAPNLLSQLPQALSRLWQGILGLFGFRRKRRPWGRVVDAATGEAVAGAYVQVFDHQTKKLQNTMTTNAQGAFSSLVPAGMYEFRVHKPGWTLTPQAPFLRLVAGERIYDGKPVAVTEEKVLPLVLALRMTEAIPLTHHLIWRKSIQAVELFIARLSWPLLAIGALLNSLSVFASPTPLAMGIEVFYALLIGWKLHLRFKQRPAIGYVRDVVTNRPLDLALVRLYDAITGKLIETRTTTAEGKFLLLPSPGVYTISVVREGYAPYREAHVVVNPKREALALAFTLKPLPMGQMGVAMGAAA